MARVTSLHRNSIGVVQLWAVLMVVWLQVAIPAAAAAAPHRLSSSFTFSVTDITAHRRLLAPTGCASSSRALLTNGYFSMGDNADPRNMLVAATMANDAYPWTKEFGFGIIDVVQGLRPDQVAAYHKLFTDKYVKLGATSVEFTHQYTPNADAAAHVIVIGTPKNVFLVFRGTADIGQGWTTADISSLPHTAFNKTLQLYKAPYKSTMLAWPWAVAAVRKAVAATERPHAAKVYTTGHSLGGASAYISALLLREQGLNIGGVYAFGPYKTGTACSPDQDCWVTVYDRYLADVTSFWWNNQDPIPALLDNALGTTFANSAWGHVPRNKGWWRVVGDECVKASGTPLADICPSEVDAADGAADGVCSRTLVEAHMPWVYLQKVARCTLLQDTRDGDSKRMDSCLRSAVWEGLLGLVAPFGRSESATVQRLGDLTAATPTQVIDAALYGLRPAHGKL